MDLKVKDLDFAIGRHKILQDITFKIKNKEFLGIIGPNGSGKSTLLKNIYRLYKPSRGVIYLNGRDIQSIPGKTFARNVAVMAQENYVGFDLRVIDMVLMGRYPYKGALERTSQKDEAIALQSLKKVGLSDYEKRYFLSLSGGEKQRVLIARALAQQPNLFILDEPTNHLDIQYQYQIMNVLKKEPITVLVALHDLNIAALYCDRLLVLKNGRLVKSGTPREIITSKLIRDLYGIDSHVTFSKANGHPQVQFLPPLSG